MEKGKNRAECKYCENVTFACDVRSNGSKNVKYHWKRCPANPTNKSKMKGKQTELVFIDSEGGEAKVKNWVLNVKDVRDAISYMIIVGELPFRHVEKPGFKHLMATCCPKFHIPSLFTIARDCLHLYGKEKTNLKEILRMNVKEFHHKGKAIAKHVEECLVDWGLDDKLFIVTVHNASSNDVACLELKKMMQRKSTCIGNGDYLHMSQLSPSLDVPTRWNSTFDMLDRALKFRDIFWRMDIPTNPQLDSTMEAELDGDDNGDPIELQFEMENAGAPSENDWKGQLEKMNVLIYMGAILDPKVKLVGLNLVFDRMYGKTKGEELGEAVHNKACKLFDDYRRIYAPFSPSNDEVTSASSSHSTSFDHKKVIEEQVKRLRTANRYSSSEFDRYLNEKLREHELDMDILDWWKMNAHRYPILARLARDVLAVPISTMVEALICTQGWIRSKKENDERLNVEEKLEDLKQLEKEFENSSLSGDN
ncbi:zinc finger BED domain-containing protein RICESLEEPER 4-like [Spinacia oleracea]|uniref:Zinc finger BED domain-containing protein RICESLEEPER 4-like n=1 Tax=Spinacia oleracea TaxID=3562 RepID=A0ABM3RHE8_SPIOL|nr:zinc finger BED domain-containing protein RICESLEEPER 4-like [Spinacia oleracea]